jgi:uncharacterized protein
VIAHSLALHGGNRTSDAVEKSIRIALSIMERIPVNAVYRPDTLKLLPETIDYFSSLGVRHIYLNPDYSARWTENDVAAIAPAFQAVGERYMNFYRSGQPHFISVIDSKITVMLRGGYQPLERCRMGTGEFAFAPSGEIFPCERLAASDPDRHAIGSIKGEFKIDPTLRHIAPGPSVNEPCTECGLQPYCVNWCGCSNYFMTGYYNRVSPFLCESEQTLIKLAAHIFATLESELGPTFMDHLGGNGLARSVWNLTGNEADRPQSRDFPA